MIIPWEHSFDIQVPLAIHDLKFFEAQSSNYRVKILCAS